MAGKTAALTLTNRLALVLMLCRPALGLGQQPASSPRPTVSLEHVVTAGDLVQVSRHLDWGASSDHRTSWDGETLLHLAARAGRAEITALLLSRGADANAAEPNGLTPMHRAAERGHVAVCERLLAECAWVNAGVPGAVDTPCIRRPATATRTWWRCSWPMVRR